MPRQTPEQRKHEAEVAKLKRELKTNRPEPKAAFVKRMHAEGRFEQFRAQAVLLRDDSHGELTLEQAKDQLRPHYTPLEGIQPTLAIHDAPACLEWSDDVDEGTFYEVLDWVMATLGRSDAGAQIKAATAPGPRSWGLLTWAKKNRKDFNALYAKEAVRESTASAADQVGARRTKYAIEETTEMLNDLREGVPA